MSPSPQHYLKDEPQITLWTGGPSFSLFYDYDQIRDHKLSGLSGIQKTLWFKARIEMTFLEPLHRIFTSPSSDSFNELLDTSSNQPLSFSIALMSVMLNGVEALGSFFRPDLCRPYSKTDKNKKIFLAFTEKYITDWWNKPVPGGNPDVTEILWRNFRNGIAHGFQIERPGSLEFLPNQKFQWTGTVLQVCPIHFFRDLEAGVRAYFNDLDTSQGIRSRFLTRFNYVYPA